MVLFLSAFLRDEVGAAEGGQHCDARAERSGGTLVAGLAVGGQHRHVNFTFTVAILLGRVATLEEATAIGIGESGHAQSEDDCDC